MLSQTEKIITKSSIRFKIGLFFLLFNIPFGLGGAGICAAMALKSTHPGFYTMLGATIYISSWIMLGIGILLAGKEGYFLSKKIIKSYFSREKINGNRSTRK